MEKSSEGLELATNQYGYCDVYHIIQNVQFHYTKWMRSEKTKETMAQEGIRLTGDHPGNKNRDMKVDIKRHTEEAVVP